MHTLDWLEWANLLAVTVNALSFALNYGSIVRSRRLNRRLLDRLHDWDAEVSRMTRATIRLDEFDPSIGR